MLIEGVSFNNRIYLFGEDYYDQRRLVNNQIFVFPENCESEIIEDYYLPLTNL